jgi:hypothetical protein
MQREPDLRRKERTEPRTAVDETDDGPASAPAIPEKIDPPA